MEGPLRGHPFPPDSYDSKETEAIERLVKVKCLIRGRIWTKVSDSRPNSLSVTPSPDSCKQSFPSLSLSFFLKKHIRPDQCL